jgi:hypothetical protein
VTLLPLLHATWRGWLAVRALRRGGLITDSAGLRRDAPDRAGTTRSPTRDLTGLRLRWRLLTGGRASARHETVFLAAALLALGHPARLVVGREIAPVSGNARYLSWVEVADTVLFTGLPVHELYFPVAVLPSVGPVGQKNHTPHRTHIR